MTMSLVETLEAFNRKERHLLREQATGTGRTVALSQGFRQQLGAALGTAVPDHHLVAVDFHLNWLYAALLHHSGKLDGPAHPIAPPLADDVHQRRAYEPNQEDIDLVVAFESDTVTHVALVEAKGFTSWSNKQMESKLRRLDRVVADASPGPDVALHLVLASFKPAEKLTVDWGQWANDGTGPPHIVLAKPENRLVVEECDAEGNRLRGGGHVHLRG